MRKTCALHTCSASSANLGAPSQAFGPVHKPRLLNRRGGPRDASPGREPPQPPDTGHAVGADSANRGGTAAASAGADGPSFIRAGPRPPAPTPDSSPAPWQGEGAVMHGSVGLLVAGTPVDQLGESLSRLGPQKSGYLALRIE